MFSDVLGFAVNFFRFLLDFQDGSQHVKHIPGTFQTLSTIPREVARDQSLNSYSYILVGE